MQNVYEVIIDACCKETVVAYNDEDAELKIRSKYDVWDDEAEVNFVCYYETEDSEYDKWNNSFSL